MNGMLLGIEVYTEPGLIFPCLLGDCLSVNLVNKKPELLPHWNWVCALDKLEQQFGEDSRSSVGHRTVLCYITVPSIDDIITSLSQ